MRTFWLSLMATTLALAPMTAAVAQDGKIIAPLAAGQPLGTFTVSLNGQPLATVPLTPLQDVPLAGFFGRLWDAFLMLFSR